MARKQKPVKIKRYKNSVGSANTAYKIKQLLPVIAGVVLVVLIGFFLGKPVLNFLANVGGDDSSSQDISSSSQIETSSQQDVVSQPETDSSSQIDVQTPPVVEKTRVYYYSAPANLTTEAGIDNVISQMKAKGATHLVFDVKNPDGNIYYSSANRYAGQLTADIQIDIGMLVSKLSANGITPVARMYTFMDKLISNVERSTAVMYQGTDTRWLDSSAALGGKAWANPASTVMQEYIISLTDELLSMGVKEIIYAGFHTPTGYSLDKRDFGATTDQVLAKMQSLITTLEGKVSAKGGYAAWQVEYSAVAAGGDYAHYIVHPYQLGADNIILTAKGADIDVAQIVPALETASAGGDIASLALWLTDNMNTEPAKALGDYFVA